VGEVADLVDEHRAAIAARLLVGAEHEVVEDELTASLEEVDQARLAVPALEHVLLFDPDHRQAAALGGTSASRARVACFSFTRSFSRAASHFSRETTTCATYGPPGPSRLARVRPSLVRRHARSTCTQGQNAGAPSQHRPEMTCAPHAVALSPTRSASRVFPMPGSPASSTKRPRS
jgi:hypothetical protein